jgi:hypothetical protein
VTTVLSDDVDAETWRRRENALAGGVIIWALGVSAAATLAPKATAEWLMRSEPLRIAGAIMMTVGFCGGFVDAVLIAGEWWSKPSDGELTDWERNGDDR